MSEETPRPPATAEFGAVTPNGASHVYPVVGNLKVTKFSVGAFDNNVYLVEDIDAKEALLIDASATPQRVSQELDSARIIGIAITHDHPDHTPHIESLYETFEHPPVYAHLPPMYEGITPVEDGFVISVGSAKVTVRYTPGHTPNSMCLSVDDFLFSGDTLFPGGPGNTDGDGARFNEVMTSLDRLFGELSDETRVCPGHGVDTTIGRERPNVGVWRARGW